MEDQTILNGTNAQIRKILVPVDYSECSQLAFRYALELGSLIHAEIHLFHTFYSPAFDLVELTSSKKERRKIKERIYQSEKEKEEIRFKGFYQEAIKSVKGKTGNLHIGHTLQPGIPTIEIIDFSETYLPDLIIMGTKGKNKETAIMGSVTEKIIHKSDFPVMAIPEDYIFVGVDNINSVLFVTNTDESDFESVRKLMTISDTYKLKIYYLHICKHPDSDHEKRKLEGIKNYFEQVYGDYDMTFLSTQDKDVLTQIDEMLLNYQIKIIALSRRKRGLISKLFKMSLTKRLFYHTTVPLLVFHS